MKTSWKTMVWLVVLVLLVGFEVSAAPPKSPYESFLKEAGNLASHKLMSESEADRKVGFQILDLCSVLEPKNDYITLIRGKAKRNASLDLTKPDDGKFLSVMKEEMGKTKSEFLTLLLWKLVEISNPANDEAILVLEKASAKGIDVEFDALLAGFKKELEEKAAKSVPVCSKCNGTQKCQNSKCKDGVVMGGGYDKEKKKFTEMEKECSLCKGTGECSCVAAAGPKDPIIGDWMWSSKPMTVFANGTYKQGGASGTWKAGETEKTYMFTWSAGHTDRVTLSDKNTMDVIGASGKKYVFKRIK
jgi:hypothetical protein